MKTLDEVIKAWSICFSDNSRSNCTGCPYADDDGEAACFNHDREDALHYLREYKAHQADWSYAVANSEQFAEARDKHIKALAELKRNEPLTWDELKQMEGKPVWLEYEGYTPDWEVIENVGTFKSADGLFVETHKSILHKEDIGKTWQAYRKERE